MVVNSGVVIRHHHKGSFVIDEAHLAVGRAMGRFLDTNIIDLSW